MQHFTYLENQYTHVDLHARLVVEYNDDHEEFKFTAIADGVRVVNDLSVARAAMLAGFLLSKHPAIVKGDAITFSSLTRACDAIPEANFTVITPGHELLAKSEEPDAKDDDQDVKVTVTSPSPESARRAGKEFAEQLSKVWFDKDDTLKEQDAKDDEPDIGDLHPDQERRLTALREAAEILAGRLTHDRLIEWAAWILNGDTGKED